MDRGLFSIPVKAWRSFAEKKLPNIEWILQFTWADKLKTYVILRNYGNFRSRSWSFTINTVQRVVSSLLSSFFYFWCNCFQRKQEDITLPNRWSRFRHQNIWICHRAVHEMIRKKNLVWIQRTVSLYQWKQPSTHCSLNQSVILSVQSDHEVVWGVT